MTIIVGLGNPGEQYKKTRHNIGFMVLDKFAEKKNFPDFKLQKKSNALISEAPFDSAQGNENIILVKPQTFMNESGKAVKALTKSDKDKNLIIVHDDIDLPVGKIKIIQERGSAGHKGVESIIKNIGNNGLIRIRVGIAPKKDMEAKKVVLKNFSEEEQSALNEIINRASDSLDVLIKDGLDRAMNEFNK